MNARQTLRIAWQAVKDNRLRSTLTTLGVIIGVASVITLVTLGTSLQASLLTGFDGAGTRSIGISATPAGPGPGPGAPAGVAGQAVFTDRDADALAALPNASHVVRRGSVAVASVRVGDRTVALNEVTAVDPVMFESETLREGRAFEPASNEAVIDAAISEMFPDALAVGDTFDVRFADGREATLTVSGILAPADMDFANAFATPAVYVPIDPHYRRTVLTDAGDEQRVYPQLSLSATDVSSVATLSDAACDYLETASDARTLLPERHAFSLFTDDQILAQLRTVLDGVTGFVTGIALISLLVGSIGIANIMLVSVTERTREIGIMKAIGGQRPTIVRLFLTEAILLGVIGAVIGTALGIAVAFIATTLLSFPFTMPVTWIAVAVLVGVLVGLLAGAYPAARAARLDPIQALRYE